MTEIERLDPLSILDPPPRVMKIKTKINKWNLIKLKRFFTTKQNKQDEKTTLRMGENICK